MKKTLKQQLEEALKDAEHQREQKDRYYEKYSHAEEELKKDRINKYQAVERHYQSEREKSDLLFEIIRWMINPTNSKDPWNEIERQSKNVPPKYY